MKRGPLVGALKVKSQPFMSPCPRRNLNSGQWVPGSACECVALSVYYIISHDVPSPDMWATIIGVPPGILKRYRHDKKDFGLGINF